MTKDENIDNHRCIGNSILWIYQGYTGYIGDILDISKDILKKKMSIDLKLIKIHENVRIVKM